MLAQRNGANVSLPDVKAFGALTGIPVTVVPDGGHNLPKAYVGDLLDQCAKKLVKLSPHRLSSLTAPPSGLANSKNRRARRSLSHKAMCVCHGVRVGVFSEENRGQKRVELASVDTVSTTPWHTQNCACSPRVLG
jgi:hypothetical protein